MYMAFLSLHSSGMIRVLECTDYCTVVYDTLHCSATMIMLYQKHEDCDCKT